MALRRIIVGALAAGLVLATTPLRASPPRDARPAASMPAVVAQASDQVGMGGVDAAGRTPSAEAQSTGPVKRYARARVNVRAAAHLGSPWVKTLEAGTSVLVVAEDGDWVRVADEDSRPLGWMFAYQLGEEPPSGLVVAAPRERDDSATVPRVAIWPPAPEPAAPPISREEIVKRLVAESKAAYGGACACPDDRDRGGRICAHRSLYSRTGGKGVLCNPEDVTSAMVSAYQQRAGQGTP